jgi:putative transposase
MRYTTFRFALAPTPLQAAMLARHAGASRFACNQCLRLVLDALKAKRVDPQVSVPWSRFDLINGFNAWKYSQAAGRMFVAASDGTITEQVTGLTWRHAVSAQVFEEAAVDLGRALAAYRDAKTGMRKGRRVGFPKPGSTDAGFSWLTGRRRASTGSVSARFVMLRGDRGRRAGRSGAITWA